MCKDVNNFPEDMIFMKESPKIELQGAKHAVINTKCTLIRTLAGWLVG